MKKQELQPVTAKQWITRINKNSKKRLTDSIQAVKNIQEAKQIMDYWTFREKLTKLRQAQLKSGKLSLEQAKEIIILKLQETAEKEKQQDIDRIVRIFATPKNITNISITVEWKKSKMWGSNPTAFINISKDDHTRDSFESRSISGCGYDKESTAIAEALNQSDQILHYLMSKRTKSYGRSFYEHSNIITFSGGVGTNCFYNIFKELRFEMKNISSGKTFDVWNVDKSK